MYDPEIQRRQMQENVHLGIGLLVIRYILVGFLLLWGEPDLLDAVVHLIHEVPGIWK